jgi:hypothetical protein
MNAPHTTNTDDVYRFVERLMPECRKGDEPVLLGQLDDALHLGSSGLEILGAIRKALIENREVIARLIGGTGVAEADGVIAFVDKAYGR